ncbi:unnamed protein product [Microthlaspi erraticum]|uniref:Uncharacterized protein n=1 Tax=Microthlaspi erraticum TaxID=1685480 RepID=A0A6D2HFM6_9BRAS|nr:unnamed protein product [Microthlaspi erraticum]
MPLEVCNLDEQFRRYHVCTEDWLTAGRTHSAGQEGNWLRSAFSRTDRTTPSEPGGNGPRSTENITSRPTPTADQTHGRPDLREQEAHLCSFDFQPVNLNRLVEDLGHYKYSFLASLEERAA